MSAIGLSWVLLPWIIHQVVSFRLYIGVTSLDATLAAYVIGCLSYRASLDATQVMHPPHTGHHLGYIWVLVLTRVVSYRLPSHGVAFSRLSEEIWLAGRFT